MSLLHAGHQLFTRCAMNNLGVIDSKFRFRTVGRKSDIVRAYFADSVLLSRDGKGDARESLRHEHTNKIDRLSVWLMMERE